MPGKAHELDRSNRLSERKHKTFLQLNEKDFKNPSGDHQWTNIIWEIQNNELNRQINVITTHTFNCGNNEIKLTWTTETKNTWITVDSGELSTGLPSYGTPYHSKVVRVHDWLSRKRSLWLRLSIGDWEWRSLWLRLSIGDWEWQSLWSKKRLNIENTIAMVETKVGDEKW